MGRQARKIRDSNIYHVMLRGVDRQVSFEDQQDEDKFLSLLCGFCTFHTAAGAADYLHKRGYPGSLH